MLFYYPSKDFLHKSIQCMEEKKDVEIVVENKKKIKMLMDHLPLLLDDSYERNGIFKIFFRQLMLMDFLAVYGKAYTLGGYNVEYQLVEKNLHVFFKRK